MMNDKYELEKTIIGTIIAFNDTRYSDGYFRLNEKMFELEENKILFKAIQILIDESNKIDLLTVTHQVRKMNKIDIVSPSYIALSVSKITNSVNFDEHCAILAQIYMRTNGVSISQNLLLMMQDESIDVFDALAKACEMIENLLSDDSLKKDDTIDVLVEQTKNEILNRNGDGIIGLSTGIYSVDKWTLGFEKGGLTILAGRPGVGKTTSALSMINKMAIMNTTKVAFFSLEMKSPQIIQKMICINGNLKTTNVSKGRLTENEKLLIEKSSNLISKSNFQIFDNYFSLNQIISKSRALHMRGELDCIFVDYLQLIEGNKEKNSNREQEISGISRRLKRLAMQLNVPVIALAQLNRDIEKRVDKVPKLSDLRESGSLEQDASLVLFCYRDESPDETGQVQHEKAILICGKNRNGNPRDIELHYRYETSQEWADLSEVNTFQIKEDDTFPSVVRQISNNF